MYVYGFRERERKKRMNPATYIRIYRVSNNGERIVETNALTFDDFVAHCPTAVLRALEATAGDEEYTLDYVLPALFELAFKLKGYKASSVQEQRVLLSGSVWPAEDDLIATSASTSVRPLDIPEAPADYMSAAKDLGAYDALKSEI